MLEHIEYLWVHFALCNPVGHSSINNIVAFHQTVFLCSWLHKPRKKELRCLVTTCWWVGSNGWKNTARTCSAYMFSEGLRGTTLKQCLEFLEWPSGLKSVSNCSSAGDFFFFFFYLCVQRLNVSYKNFVRSVQFSRLLVVNKDFDWQQFGES